VGGGGAQAVADAGLRGTAPTARDVTVDMITGLRHIYVTAAKGLPLAESALDAAKQVQPRCAIMAINPHTRACGRRF